MAIEITRIDNTGNRDQPCRKQGEVRVQLPRDYLPLETRWRKWEAAKEAKEGIFRKKYPGKENLKSVGYIKCWQKFKNYLENNEEIMN